MQCLMAYVSIMCVPRFSSTGPHAAFQTCVSHAFLPQALMQCLMFNVSNTCVPRFSSTGLHAVFNVSNMCVPHSSSTGLHAVCWTCLSHALLPLFSLYTVCLLLYPRPSCMTKHAKRAVTLACVPHALIPVWPSMQWRLHVNLTLSFLYDRVFNYTFICHTLSGLHTASTPVRKPAHTWPTSSRTPQKSYIPATSVTPLTKSSKVSSSANLRSRQRAWSAPTRPCAGWVRRWSCSWSLH